MENVRNNNKTKEAIKIMTAYLEGAPIQLRGGVFDDWTDCTPNPEWDWMHYEYRIKAKHKYRACKNTRELYIQKIQYKKLGKEKLPSILKLK